MKKYIETSKTQNIFRIIIAFAMIFAGISHLTFNRSDFTAQVPNWVPMSKDLVVVLSGIVEILLGLGLAFWKTQRVNFGWALAVFYILIFPGNIAQYINGTDAFGALNSDKTRLIRLFFQPILIIWALWSAGSWKAWQTRSK